MLYKVTHCVGHVSVSIIMGLCDDGLALSHKQSRQVDSIIVDVYASHDYKSETHKG